MFNRIESKYLPISEKNSKVDWTVKILGYNDLVAGGNKHYKLKYNMIRAKELGINHLVTVGGAYSNHIAATARAGRDMGFRTTGIIRGEPVTNQTLERAKADGMRLVFVDRARYRMRSMPGFAADVLKELTDWWFIPEGGNNDEGIQGCTEILDPVDEIYDIITVCCGTGSTAMGLAQSLKPHQRLLVFNVVRDDKVLPFASPKVEMIHDYHFGGYARKTAELESFCSSFHKKNQIQIEPIYTGKMFFGLQELISKGFFEKGIRILSLHTGGLQYCIPEPIAV
jgi:1-aminocyclopropane-1-carboxylate deaminase/D-cysteine desulfhydrase-like pyridoxal-dependent ACC family enzyme